MKVSKNYLDEFFMKNEVKKLIKDVEDDTATEKEIGLLKYLGLKLEIE